MAAWLVDECVSALLVAELRGLGHDVRYAAETDHRAADRDLLAVANAENRVIVTEDFDFGELLVRHRLPAPGAIVAFLPDFSAAERVDRMIGVITAAGFEAMGRLTIIEARRVRQRVLERDA